MRWLSLPAVLLLGGCPSDPPPACTTVAIDTSCAPGYMPTFDNVFIETINIGCGSRSGACHSARGAGGMNLSDPATAYASLLDGHVTPGDPACSEIIVRTHGIGEDYQMPPGAALDAPERCALVKWVAAGAPGPGEPLP